MIINAYRFGGVATPDFLISPAYAGKSSWNLAVDGPLNIGTYGEYTITPTRDFTVTTKMWGAGGARGADYNGAIGSTVQQGPGGGGGYSTATIVLRSGSTYTVQVGQGGARTATKTPTNATYLAGGVGAVASWGTQGGGYSGIFKTSVTQGNALLMAGGGGGGGDSSFDGTGDCAGGGTTGASSRGFVSGSSQWGGHGTASAGGSASPYNTATTGSALTGGRGQMTAPSASLGGGGGGYFGGGGGNVGSGGGGSGRVGTDGDISGGSTTVGSIDTPANSADGDRNGAGRGGNATSNTGADGRIILTLVP